MSRLTSYEPATGKLLWEGQPSDVDADLAAVGRAWQAWAAQPFSYRIETLRRFANIVRGAEATLADLTARETGRPLWDARNEVAAAVDAIEPAISAYLERTGQRRTDGAMGARQALRHKPHGVVLILAPHSSPLAHPAAQIAAALIAGNGVLFKPSERTPATGAQLVARFHEAGVPPDLLRCLLGGPDTGRAAASHANVNAVLFSGCIQSGISLNRALAAHPDKLLALEMGGNNPMILWDTPDIAAAVALTVQSTFVSTGQRNGCGRRLIVHDRIADLVLDELCRVTGRLIIDHPHADPAPFMGPVIDMETADGLTESFLYLMSNGGKPLTHMRRLVDGLPFVTPGIIDVTNMQQRPDVELFGPILQVVRVPNFDAAIAEANSTRFGLSAALFGGSEEDYNRFWATSRAGIVNWNRPTTMIAPSAPSGGVGVSGNHRPGGSYTADSCAYPVVSAEIHQPRHAIGIGLKALEVLADR